MDQEEEVLDEVQAERENNLAQKSGKEALKKQQKKQGRKKITKIIPKVVVQAIKKYAIIIGAIVVGIVLLSAIVMFILELEEQQALYEQQLNNTTRTLSLQEYLRQFSHSGEAPQSEDGRFYKMYGDGAGWPTIGASDLQWKSHQTKFACSGKVLTSSGEQTVENVQEYVNSFLTRGSAAQYTDAEIEAMGIYIEKELVDEAGGETAENTYQNVLQEVEHLDLSEQQIFPLVAIAYNFSLNLPTRRGRTFVEVYEEGAGLYQINSWEHMRYIWDNWWCYVGGGSPGHYKARDAAFETFVKGVYDFSESEAGTVFERKYYIYYTQAQLDYLEQYDLDPRNGSMPNLEVTRNPINEREIFTYVESSGISGGTILEVCEQVMWEMVENNVHYSLDLNKLAPNVESASNFSKYPYACCATYVSVVLYKSGALTADFINKYSIHSTGTINETGVNRMLKDAGWTYISEEEAQPGDVCVWKGHTFIYAGDGYIWDQNCGCISSSGKQPSKAPIHCWEKYKNENDLDIWRMP